MAQGNRKIVIIGGGVAGLCTAVYARRCGYEVELLEQHHSPGGLAASWRRGDYTFETCLHWLVGSNPTGTLHPEWREVCDIDSLSFVDHDEFVRLESEAGASLAIYSNVDRLEAELLKVSPKDSKEIRHFTAAIRQLADMRMPPLGASLGDQLVELVRMLPDLPLLWRLSQTSVESYARRFSHPLLKRFFNAGGTGSLSALALVLSLAWMSGRNAGYAVGGSQALIRLIAERLAELGGRLRCDAKVRTILVENDVAVGVELESGETISADWVISAADCHATLHGMLGGRYTSPAFEKAFASYETFPSYLQVSLGVARDLSMEPGYLTLVLDKSVEVDPQTRVKTLSFRIFHYDPTFAPPGKTAVTCLLSTRNVGWWTGLRDSDPERYQVEKQRVAEAVVAVLERRLPGVREAIETIDVSTPATIVSHTGNWKGSMEGWLLTPRTGLAGLPQILPGLKGFAMAGQWVQPGGGLPSGLITARAAIQAICRKDHTPFLAEPPAAGAPATLHTPAANAA